MSYGIEQIRRLRKEVWKLKPSVNARDAKAYRKLRDDVITSFLPYGVNQVPLIEEGKYKNALAANDGYLETVLYGEIWDDLLPNERLAIEHLYYENPALVGEDTQLYDNIHNYVEARLEGDEIAAEQHLQNSLWEILHNSPLGARNELERDNARHRRSAQTTMLNTLKVSKSEIYTPDYIIEPIRNRYKNTPLHELLPEIVFPLEDNARLLAEEIQEINAAMQQSFFSLKSIISESENIPEATDAFSELYITIIQDGTEKLIDKELDKLAKQGKNTKQILSSMDKAFEHYQDLTIPNKMDMLATHFNGKLSEVEQRKEGYTHYIWHSMDDPKVRPSHAANDEKIFSWDNPPETGHPGEEYNCRCYAEPAFKDPPLEDVPLELLIPVVALRRIVIEGSKRIGKTIAKVFRNPISKRPKNIPKDWVKKPSNKKDGYKYVDPKNKHNDVRVQKGDPKSQYPNSQEDYVRWKKDGKWLDKDGKSSTDKGKTHIPLDEFKFDKDVFK